VDVFTEMGPLLFFLGASALFIAAPGPDVIYVIARGVAQGRKVALVSAWGVCVGMLVHTSFAAAGLSAVLAQSVVAFRVVKYAGAAYLLYLGVRTLLDKQGFGATPQGRPTVGLKKTFLQGVASNVLNPKVALFFLAFLPQFVGPTRNAAPQLLVLGLLFVVVGLGVLCAMAFFAGTIGELLRKRHGAAEVLRWTMGIVLIALGFLLALP
jgi:threonine/homoserine/homoserine lactone efflux protein